MIIGNSFSDHCLPKFVALSISLKTNWAICVGVRMILSLSCRSPFFYDVKMEAIRHF